MFTKLRALYDSKEMFEKLRELYSSGEIKTFTNLDLNSNNISDHDVKELIKILDLKVNSTLINLNLSLNNISNEEFIL